MAIAQTYEPLATQTLGGASSSVSFNSISADYTDLVLVIDGTVGSNTGIQLRFNGDSGTNYSFIRVAGSGTSASSDRSSNATFMELGYYLSGNRNMNVIHIMNYSSTSIYKTVINRASATTANIGAMAFAELWRSTAAVNSITINASGNLSSGSTLTLYGIKAA
jgi:hypothetical protein